jgi:seryl-tRNA(Sec) selenium transferase
MKPDSPFSKLPSLNELLNHPTVAQVVKRVNQTTIAQRATGFLDELQTNLRHRWEQGHVPSLGQLAERFARRLLGPAQSSLPAVNATGVLLGDRWPSLPLAETAINEIVRIASDYHANDALLTERVQNSLKTLTGAEAALVVNSFRTASEMVRSRTGHIDVARFAGTIDPAVHGHESYTTLANHIENGADLVVADGAGLLGGPPCGIIIGRREMVEAASYDFIASLAKPDFLTLAALAITLSIYEKNESVIHQIPIWQLLTTPAENLEQRANRLAMLIESSDKIEWAKSESCQGAWCDTDVMKLTGPSWSIHIKPHAEAVDSVHTSLTEASPQVLARIEQDELFFDLRGVFPRWDQHLVSILS